MISTNVLVPCRARVNASDNYFESLTKEKSFNGVDNSVCEGLVTIEELI